MGKVITNIDQLDPNGVYTYADYLLWRLSDRVELIKGKIFKMSLAPARQHQMISGKLNRYLDRYFEFHPCGLYYAPFDVRLINFKKSTIDNQILSVVQPDLCIICDEKKLDDRGCIGAPDLVIEILSPGNSKKEMGVKFNLYEENAVKEYWIVDPTERAIFIYTLKEGKYSGLKPCIEGEKVTSPLFENLNFEVEKIFEGV
jgi:Uma2 family endonuclease